MRRHSVFSIFSMLAWLVLPLLPCRFYADDGGAGSGGADAGAGAAGGQSAGDGQQAAGGVADVQAHVDAALAKQRADLDAQHLAEFEKATGHKSLKAYTEAKLAEEGNLKELADSRGQEAQAYKTKFEQAAIGNALLSAAGEAVDPAIVVQLLAGRAVCDDNGAVTVDGKPVAEAVAALLADKPYLAKAQGDTGSGAGGGTGRGGKQISRDQLNALSPQAQADHFRHGGTVI